MSRTPCQNRRDIEQCIFYQGHPAGMCVYPSDLWQGKAESLGVERLAEAIRNVRESDPLEWLERGDEADAIAAEYVRITAAPPSEKDARRSA